LPRDGLHGVCANWNCDLHDVRGFGADWLDGVSVSRTDSGCSRHTRSLLKHGGSDDLSASYYRAAKLGSDGGLGRTNQFVMDSRNGNRRDDQHLSGGALHGRELHIVRADRHVHDHNLQRHGTDRVDQLQLSRARKRYRGEHRAVFDDSFGHDDGSRDFGARRLDGNGCIQFADQFVLGGFDGNRRRDRELPGGALHGSSLYDVRADRHIDDHNVQ
jgi:hypothetical protein